MQLQLATWQEVEAYLEGSTGIVVPVGATEQHGPNGLIGTDAICPETIALQVGLETRTLVAPTLSVGMSQHHMGFPGTVTLRPATLLAVVRDVIDSLLRHGFNHIYFINGHGGNIATVQAAFSEVYAALGAEPDAPALRLRLRNWWSGQRVQALSKQLFGEADGSHATASEVSVSWYARPAAQKSSEMSPKVAPVGPIRDAADFRRRFPDGRIGSDPSLATIEAGEKLCRAAVEDVVEDYRKFVGA